LKKKGNRKEETLDLDECMKIKGYVIIEAGPEGW
jgi:hypothetical protein